MRLSDLIDGNGAAAEIEVAGLCCDSRQARPGFLFAALAGSQADGTAFIGDAVDHGAVAVLATPGTEVTGPAVRLVADENPRRRLAQMAARFYARQPSTIAAVTGTNGKTSVTAFTRQIWTQLGLPAASFGTLGIEAADFSLPLAHTTPEPIVLHRMLADIAVRGIEHLALEASSHGLAQYRLDGVTLRAAAFTNLSRDHLDYHGSSTAYYSAKERLFSEVMVGGTAVLNADDPAFDDLAAACRARGHRLVDYGRRGTVIRLLSDRHDTLGQRLDLEVEGARLQVLLPLVGTFQAGNALCALGLVLACGGAAPDLAVAALEQLKGARGRLELVGRHPCGAPAYVDYAHTPDALANVLAALRRHTDKRLWVVFGCGGDRDKGKRLQMGAVARRLADRVIVTDDNPRNEAPLAIRGAIMAACPEAVDIGSREDAIAHAVSGLAAGDTLVVAGKGHEQGQTVADEVHPFDDAAVVRASLGESGEAP